MNFTNSISFGVNNQSIEHDNYNSMRKQASNSSIKYSASFKQQTERALRTINEHEKLKQMWSMSVYMRAQTQTNNQVEHPVKVFNCNQQVKLQLLPNSIAYYKLPFSASIDPRIIIRQFRGGPVDTFICFNKLSKDLDSAAYHFVVRDQIILKFGRKAQPDQVKNIYFVFRNESNLSMLVFRVDTIREKKKKKGVIHNHSMEKKQENQKSIESIDLEAQSQKKINIPAIVHRRNKSLKDKLRSVSLSAQLLSQRPQHKLKKIEQLKSIQIEKQEAAKKRIGNLEIYKQKSAEVERVAAKCKKMFSTYADLVDQQEELKSSIVRAYTPITYLIKFCLISSFFHNENDLSMKKAMTIKSYFKKFNRKIRRAYHETLQLQPSKTLRQQKAVDHLTSLMGHIIFKMDTKRAGDVALQTFQLCRPGLFVNLAMNKSSDYRRVVRSVQRRWKSRFEARTSMLLGYAEEQLQVIIKSYPQLSHVEQQYRKANRAYYIVIEYQKDTASKIVDLIGAYYHKLEEIEQYKKMNQQIKQFNATALKKHVKQLLEVPKKPAFPQFRFFRDLLFLKAMIRGELEVLLRKLKKTNADLFKEKDSSPVKADKKLKKSK